jgi:hypothetical protein
VARDAAKAAGLTHDEAHSVHDHPYQRQPGFRWKTQASIAWSTSPTSQGAGDPPRRVPAPGLSASEWNLGDMQGPNSAERYRNQTAIDQGPLRKAVRLDGLSAWELGAGTTSY